MKKISNTFGLDKNAEYRMCGWNFAQGDTRCQHCNARLKIVCFLKDENGIEYSVGSDCAETLSNFDKNTKWDEFETELSQSKKLCKVVKESEKDTNITNVWLVPFSDSYSYLYFTRNNIGRNGDTAPVTVVVNNKPIRTTVPCTHISFVKPAHRIKTDIANSSEFLHGYLVDRDTIESVEPPLFDVGVEMLKEKSDLWK